MLVRSLVFFNIIFVVITGTQSQTPATKFVDCPNGAGNPAYTDVGINLFEDKFEVIINKLSTDHSAAIVCKGVEFTYKDGPKLMKIPIMLFGMGKLKYPSTGKTDMTGIVYSNLIRRPSFHAACDDVLPDEKFWEKCIRKQLKDIPFSHMKLTYAD